MSDDQNTPNPDALLQSLLNRQESYLNKAFDTMHRATVFVTILLIIIIGLGALASYHFVIHRAEHHPDPHVSDMAAALFFVALLLFIVAIYIHHQSYTNISYYYSLFNRLKEPIDKLAAPTDEVLQSLHGLNGLKEEFLRTRLSQSGKLLSYAAVFVTAAPGIVLSYCNQSHLPYRAVYIGGAVAAFVLQHKLNQSLAGMLTQLSNAQSNK